MSPHRPQLLPKYGLLLFGLALITTLLQSCNKGEKELLSPQAHDASYGNFIADITAETNQAKITLQRTACFGSCPVYALAIFENGNVQFFGKQFVAKIGLYQSQIEPDKVNTLIQYALEMDYFDLKEGYHSKADTAADGTITHIFISDLPTTQTSIKYRGKRKVIANYYGGPQWLTAFEEKIDSIAHVRQWTL